MLSLQARSLLEHAGGDVYARGDGTFFGQPARALTGTAADLEDLASAHIAEQISSIGFVNSLGTPHELRGAQETAVFGEVLLGGIVPIPSVGAY